MDTLKKNKFKRNNLFAKQYQAYLDYYNLDRNGNEKNDSGNVLRRLNSSYYEAHLQKIEKLKIEFNNYNPQEIVDFFGPAYNLLPLDFRSKNGYIMESADYSNSLKEYPDGSKVLKVYKEPLNIVRYNYSLMDKVTQEEIKERTKQTKEANKKLLKSDKDLQIENVQRASRAASSRIKDIARSNNFNYFGTLTFDPKNEELKGIDLSDLKSVWPVVTKFIRKINDFINNNKLPKTFKYIIIPERHKSGNFHFHTLITVPEALLSIAEGSFKGRDRFNLPIWSYGFSSLIAIEEGNESRAKLSHYITKYITKDVSDSSYFGIPRYKCSRGLSRPIKSTNVKLTKNDFEEYKKVDLPDHLGFNMYVINK